LKALSLYQDKRTIIHHVDAISKLLYILASVLIPVILSDMIYGIAWAALSVMILFIGKVLKKVVPIIGFSLFILLSMIIIQGLFNQSNETIMFQMLGLTFYREGLLFAFGICIRVLNILCSFAILVLTTKPSDLIETFVRRGMSPRIGYVLASVLQIIPQMAGTMETITDAQRSRGMETEGKLGVRIKAFIPLIGPVVMSSLISTRERSMALEVRGFNSTMHKSFLNEELKHTYNTYIQISIIAIMILTVVWRVIS
jgi:energy-coupling factor transport system permease protein